MKKLRTVPLTNRGMPTAADPWVVRDGSRYFYCFSGRGGICVALCENLSDVITARERAVCVWTPPAGEMYSREIWAPELHRIGGKWYIYFAADDGKNDNHRMYVLESTDDSNPTAPFRFIGKITDKTDRWAIDGTVFSLGDELYFVWSGWEGEQNIAQNLYIAHMSSPTEIDSERVCISRPIYPWETNSNPLVNEGPAALVRGSTVTLIYSASGSWLDSYCLAALTYRGGDILSPDAWEKADTPAATAVPGSYGPGHCSFAEAPDGTVWMFCHANEVSGTGWRGRSLRMQPITWDGDTPCLGDILTPDTEILVPLKED